jgi:hypothetical protein
MERVQTPAFVQYHTVISVQSGSVYAQPLPNHQLYFRITSAAGPREAQLTMATTATTSEAVVMFSQSNLSRAVYPMLNPTLNGLYSWIRYGYDGGPLTQAVTAAAVFAVDGYTPHDGGDATCANGDAARAIVLDPHGDAYTHSLRRAVVDTATGLFCALHLVAPVEHPALESATAEVDLDFTAIDAYALIASERVVLTDYGIGITQRTVADVTFSSFNFH